SLFTRWALKAHRQLFANLVTLTQLVQKPPHDDLAAREAHRANLFGQAHGRELVFLITLPKVNFELIELAVVLPLLRRLRSTLFKDFAYGVAGMAAQVSDLSDRVTLFS